VKTWDSCWQLGDPISCEKWPSMRGRVFMAGVLVDTTHRGEPVTVR